MATDTGINANKAFRLLGDACTCAAGAWVCYCDLFPFVLAAGMARVGWFIVCLAWAAVFIGEAVVRAAFSLFGGKLRLSAFGRLSLRAAAVCFVMLTAFHIKMDSYAPIVLYLAAAVYCIITSFERKGSGKNGAL